MKHIRKVILICLLLDFYCISSQVNLTSSLTACYNLNGNANDPINSLNGTLSAVTATVNRFGSVSSALAFAGNKSSFVSLPGNALIKPASAVSVSGWYKVSNFVNNSLIIFTKNVYSSYIAAYALQIQNNGGGYKFATWRQDGTKSEMAEGTTVITLNTWYHVAFTITNSSMKIYVNGKLENSIPTTITNFNYDTNKGVILGGTDESASNTPFNGSIDNLRFYSREINTAEVASLHSQDPTCGPVPVSFFSVSSSTICTRGTINAFDFSSNNPTSWSWQTPGASSSSSSMYNPVLTYANPGTYTISLTAQNKFGIGTTSTQTITVMPSPSVTASSDKTYYCKREPCILSASGASLYTWSTGQTGSVIEITVLGETIYTVTGHGAFGCTDTASIRLKVTTCHWPPQGLSELTNETFVVSPNPANDHLKIFTTGSFNGKALLFNSSGTLVNEATLNEGIVVMDLLHLQSGVYFIILTDGLKYQRVTILKE